MLCIVACFEFFEGVAKISPSSLGFFPRQAMNRCRCGMLNLVGRGGGTPVYGYIIRLISQRQSGNPGIVFQPNKFFFFLGKV